MAIISQSANKMYTVADVDPTVNEDYSHGYPVGAGWLNETTGITYVCNSDANGAAQWAATGTLPLKNNYTAIVAPTVTDDGSKAYTPGSKWVNTVTGKSYICVISTIGAANWIETSNEKTFPAGSSATAAALLSAIFGATLTEGLEIRVLDEVVACSAIENAMSQAVPKGAIILAVMANVQTLLVAAGTSATWSVGITGTVNKYGTAGFPTQADSKAKNSKSNFLQNLDTAARLAANETLKVIAAATGGAAAGDSVFSAGSVRVMVVYLKASGLADA